MGEATGWWKTEFSAAVGGHLKISRQRPGSGDENMIGIRVQTAGQHATLGAPEPQILFMPPARTADPVDADLAADAAGISGTSPRSGHPLWYGNSPAPAYWKRL